MAISFSTKARTLQQLRGRLRTAHVAPLVFFSVEKWQADPDTCAATVRQTLGDGPWIVRSSCQGEDGATSSCAGAFLSVPGVTPAAIRPAVRRVVASYAKMRKPQADDEILIQPMLQGVVRSGVALSHDPATCSPYRLINWIEGGDTTLVTGGMGGRSWQSAAGSPVVPPPELSGVLKLLAEMLSLFGGLPLDCEFAVTSKGGTETLWLLQVRPLILSREPETDAAQTRRLEQVHSKVTRGMRPHPFLMGNRTVYGVMPDWNPAEIIGIRPKPLALSLYREMVTDAIWAYQRHNYGYRNLRSFPLMPHFFGLPYIDVRLSFNSFIPADLDDVLARRLADYYLDRLLARPALHDKVEFEIVFSCYTLDLAERLKGLVEAGFSTSECGVLADSLRKLTNRIIQPESGMWQGDAHKLAILKDRREQLMASDADALERIYWLLEDAKRYGTLPFAGLARAGFIAVQMLRSLVSVDVFSEADYEAFWRGLSTVSSQLARDRAMLDKATFLSRYGHLRPGTYDILSPRYDEAPELYFDWTQKPPAPVAEKPFNFTLPQLRQVRQLLKQHGLKIDPVSLFDFLQSGIEYRELAKFHFTRNLSDALSLISGLGARWGFEREDMAYCDVAVFKELHIAAVEPRDAIQRSVERGKACYAEALKTILPPLIVHPEDIWEFEWPEIEPNFITQNQITAPVAACTDRSALAGAVVCIPSADPGFDWLFAHGIAGLVTAWGGANSHMAIRAGEMGIPAVIGAGEMLYRRWSDAGRLHIDCAARKVEVISCKR